MEYGVLLSFFAEAIREDPGGLAAALMPPFFGFLLLVVSFFFTSFPQEVMNAYHPPNRYEIIIFLVECLVIAAIASY